MEDANGNGVVDAGETDPNNSMTDGITNDIYNAAYVNTDLSGDGLVGRVKAALGMNPLDTSNPLTMTQVITGDEPDGGIRNSNNVIIDDCATAYGNTINRFFLDWMNQKALAVCKADASSPALAMPFPVKGNETFVLNGVTYHRPTANLKIVGYQGLQRTGYDSSYP